MSSLVPGHCKNVKGKIKIVIRLASQHILCCIQAYIGYRIYEGVVVRLKQMKMFDISLGKICCSLIAPQSNYYTLE